MKRQKTLGKNNGNTCIGKKGFQRSLLFVLGIVMVLMLPLFGTIRSNAGEYTGSNVVTNNIHDHVYSNNAKVSNSYLFDNGNGTFSRLENMGDIILVEIYNANFRLVSQFTVPFELSMFGGFYSGQNYNYLVYGQPNDAQDNNKECIRIVVYTKAWARVGAISVKNCNTTIPFYGSGTDICEYGDYLYIKTGHATYADAAGSRHQASMLITCQISNLSVKSVQCGLRGYYYGDVENSVAQYVDATGGVVTTVDHSNGNPRCMLLSQYPMTGAVPNVNAACAQLNAMPVTGAIGNCTLGGFEVSSQYYLVVGNTTPIGGTSPNRNIFVAAVPKYNFTSAATSINYLTGYANGELKTVETPYLVKINSEQFVIIWETRSGYTDLEEVSYVFINGAGQMTSEIKTMHGCLSDCQPVVFGNKVIWYVTNGASMKIYSLPLSANRPTTPASQAVINTAANVYQGVDYSAVFDFAYYINHYPDMRVFYANDQQGALRHFVLNGMAEGRQGCENFNVNIYRENYPDLQAAFGGDLRQYYLHFITSGSREGRNARKRIG